MVRAAGRRSHTRASPAALLVGLLGNALVGAWWLDRAVGLLIAGVAVREGLEAWQGDGCCVSSPLDGLGLIDDECQDDCCAHTDGQPAASAHVLD